MNKEFNKVAEVDGQAIILAKMLARSKTFESLWPMYLKEAYYLLKIPKENIDGKRTVT